MNTFAESDRAALAACWHPVAFADDVRETPVAADLRRMLAVEGLRKPEYSKYDALFRL